MHVLHFTPDVSQLRSTGVEFNFTLNNLVWKVEIFSVPVPNLNERGKYELEMQFYVNCVPVSNDSDSEWAYEVQETVRLIPRSGSNESVIEKLLPRKEFNKHTPKLRSVIKPIDTEAFLEDYVDVDGANIEIEVSLTPNYDLLDIPDLVSFAERTQHFSFLAQNAFARTHSGKTVKIGIEDWNSETAAVCTDSTISLKQYDLILNFLKHFGHLVSSLEISFGSHLNATDEKAQEISKNVNFYCADTLTQLKINSHQRNLFDQMTKPFSNIEDFSMTGSANDLGNSNRTANLQLFPVVRKLDLVRFQPENDKCIDVHLERLESFTVNVFKNEEIRAIPTTELTKFLQKNPQLKVLHLWHTNAKFLSIVNETCPNLRNLSLTSYDELNAAEMEMNQNLTIVFGEVTYFAVDGQQPDVPEYINVPKLIEFHGELQPNTNVEKLVEFLKTKQHLRKISLKLGNANSDTVVEQLQEGLGDQWTVAMKYNQVSLERRG